MLSKTSHLPVVAAVNLALICSSQAVVLFNNFGSPISSGSTITTTDWRALGFTTGSDSYSITTIDLFVQNLTTEGLIEIVTDNSGDPSSTSLGSFTGTGTGASETVSFTNAGVTLDANTSYWVVYKTTSGNATWNTESSNTIASGIFSFDDVKRTTNSGSSWSNFAIDDFGIRIQGDLVPEPSSLAFLSLSSLVLIRRKR